MPASTPLPRTLDAWLKQLDGQVLPIAADHHQQVRRALGDSRRSLRDIADLMQDSPALVLSVLREANSKGSALGEAAESLETALTRLGLKRAEELLARLPARALADIPLPLRQIQLISQHAAYQANGLFAARLARLWQEIHWGSLLFLSPVWVLLAAHPHLFDAWEQRVLIKGEPPVRVERDLLGVSLFELCLALAERWRLPAWITQGYRLLIDDRRLLGKALYLARRHDEPLRQQQELDADPALQRWLTQPANSILLANVIAVSAHNAWSGIHTRRWHGLTSLYLQLPPAELQQQIHQNAAHSARQVDTSGLWHPAEALLWPWSARHFQTPKPVAAAPVSDWRQLCTQLLAQPSAFSNVQQLTMCARQAVQAAGLPRLVMLLADRTHSRLQVQQHAGVAASASGLTLDPAQSQVLRRLLQKPAQLRLTPANVAQFSALLPGDLKALLPSEHLLLRSLASNERVVMLLFADQGGQPISDTTVQAFTKTTQCIERALDTFSKRKR
ncbi:HDOD domain-containing protein [Pseudomonas argentinensis]|uniref:HDOD domain-containing protein n=1 Tax=Phytopseudomonas argentinensis TaxID=289370 RepID=A0A1I3IE49_9GAMM|nr:HDOD domain-containing protein [Pseudomonas argentinensis]KAB0547725.1 HDOD domain-containing protein [Pseudomonas argentinensis]SFI46107.1 HDOD domain-containing protein [Pseudomonas argentinensis]